MHRKHQYYYGNHWPHKEFDCYSYEYCYYYYHQHCYSLLSTTIKTKSPLHAESLYSEYFPPSSAINSRSKPARLTPSVKLFLSWHLHGDVLMYLSANMTYYFKVGVQSCFVISKLLCSHAEWHWPVYLRLWNLLSSSVKLDHNRAYVIKLWQKFNQIFVNCLSQYLAQSKHLWMFAAQYNSYLITAPTRCSIDVNSLVFSCVNGLSTCRSAYRC